MTATLQTPTTETATTTWQIDPAHTDVGFSARHLMITTVRGRFAAVRGTIAIDEADITRSSVEIEIDAASIDTREPRRDAHLRSADFFDADVYPTITFRGRRVKRVGTDKLRVTGDLTIHGVTREVVLDVREEGRAQDPWGGDRAAFSAATTVDRRDFGLTWNQALETGALLVSNEIRITLDVQAVKQAQ